MAYDSDPRGYYHALGLTPAATSEEIKKAFKAKAQELHPDRNPAPDSTQRFQFLNEAFQNLNNSESRANYDTGFVGTATNEAEPFSGRLEPILCSLCQKISAQPRYAVYYQVFSFVVFTQRRVSQGIFCSKCGAAKAYRSSLATLAFGWWGFPWGPIWSLQAIVRNMFGGQQPVVNNLRILGWQSRYFASIGRLDIARAIALEALTLERKLSNSERSANPDIGRLVGTITRVLSQTDVQAATLPDVWGVGSRAFKTQAVAAVSLVCSIGLVAIVLANRPQTAYRHTPPGGEASLATEQSTATGDKAVSPKLEESRTSAVPVQVAAVFDKPILPLPPTGRMRTLWTPRPTSELAPLSVVTSNNGINYYVKLVNARTGKPVLILFIRSGETATTELPIGLYDFRYAAGEKWYGEEYLFGPQTAYTKADTQFSFRIEGNQILGHTVELIHQLNGNLKETTIAATDF